MSVEDRVEAMPYARLSSYYFFYFAALGALVPYWGPYLQERGFSPASIGILMAILMGTKILAPNLWGWLADRSGQRMPMVRLGSALAVIFFVGVFWAQGFWQMALAMIAFSFFWNAPLPLMESVTFNHLGARVNRYASVRVWGSVGFIISVGTLGWWLESAGTGVIPFMVLALFVGVFASVMITPDRGHPIHDEAHLPLRMLLQRREVLFFLVACVLMQASHGVYYAFYSIFLEANGYGTELIGALWAFGVGVEVLVFLKMYWLLERLGARWLLLTSLVLAALRWLLIGWFVESLWIQVLAQALHAASFGIFHAAAIHLVHHLFPGRTQARGQALYSSLSFGAGGAAGSLTAGLLWSSAGPALTFSLSALMALLGWLVTWRWVDRARRY